MSLAATYPESKAIEKWQHDGLTFSIVRHASLGHFCGYVRFSRRPTREAGYEGVLTYVPVHGGLTYAKQDDAGMVYGFDCGHSGDETDARVRDLSWLRAECERMALGIREAATIEKRYLRAISAKGKAKILDAYRARMKKTGCDEGFNFGVAINVLEGRL